MSILPIILYPNRTLHRPSAVVSGVDDDTRTLLANMRETMLHARGIGLAAPQVGVNKRLIVVDTSEKRDTPINLVNPQIIAREGEITHEEGCLSVPGVQALVRRAQRIGVSGLNADGEEVSFDAEDLLAVCIQHEIDHLDGVLFFDHISLLKRKRLLSKYEKLQTP